MRCVMKFVMLVICALTLAPVYSGQMGIDQQTDQKKTDQSSNDNLTTQNIDSPKVSVKGSQDKPIEFTTPDGKKGWKVVIPGNRPLATPAVVDGKIFLGAGFGSHEFYAYDAKTGKMVWKYNTADDGPTAAAVQDGYVVFNTESCEIEVLTTDGKPVWKKWLGDPLMSMPSVSKGKVYMCYPNNKSGKHHIACFDLKTGKEHWSQPITGDAITAPIISDDHVYVSCLDGTVFCFKDSDGKEIWHDNKNATSSPCIWNGQCYVSTRQEIKLNDKDRLQKEMICSYNFSTSIGKPSMKSFESSEQRADYLDYSQKKGSAQEGAKQALDKSVAWGPSNNSKGDSKIHQAEQNLGERSVAGVWSYQGSRPFVYSGSLFTAMGDTLKCFDIKNEKISWQKKFQAKTKTLSADRLLTPPALVNDKIFTCTYQGDLHCLSAKTGEILWSVNIGEQIIFQPAVADGRVYVTTNTGSLYCFETGDSKDTGWSMWGGNSEHNGIMK